MTATETPTDAPTGEGSGMMDVPTQDRVFTRYIPELSPQAEVAVLARVLDDEGWSDHSNGHITVKHAGGLLLATPFELAWDEVCASDVLTVDTTGRIIAGHWTVNPAIRLHLELHQSRADAVFAVHNHPHFGTIWAGTGRIPEPYDQLSGLLADDEIVLFDDYLGPVDGAMAAQANVAALGDRSVALLQNHGVLVVGSDIRETYFRCTAFENRSRLAWEIEAVGGGVPLTDKVRRDLSGVMPRINGSLPNIWEAAARRMIRTDPSVIN